MVGAAAVAVVCGALTAVQTRVNGQLATDLGDGMLAALISFGGGLIILALVVLLIPAGRRGVAKLRDSVVHRRTPWWYLIGGAFGALFVIGQGLSAAVIGVALFTISVVASQTVTGAVIDRVGLGDLERHPFTVARVVASVLAVAAVVFAGLTELTAEVPPLLLLLPLVTGIGTGYQQAANGQVRNVSGSSLTATLLNFVVGSVVLVVAVLIHSALVGWPETFPQNPFLYSGGLIAAVFIGGAIAVVRIIGVLVLGLATVAGQLLGALVLDLVLPISGRELALTTVIGTALTLVAVSIAALSTRSQISER